MKLLNRQQFLAQPSGIVFAKDDADIDTFQIKGNTIDENDFNYQPLVSINSDTFEEHHDAVIHLRSVLEAEADFYNWYRDGSYDEKETFVVLEKHEVRGLIERLEQTLVEGYADIIP